MEQRIYGTCNGKNCYSAEEFLLECRSHRNGMNGIGRKFTNPEEMIEYMKNNYMLHDAGWNRTFADIYLGKYEIESKFLPDEMKMLKEYQQQLRKADKDADDARGWVKVDTIHYMDNSTEETWQDKDGNTKTVMTVAPHGDLC